MVDLILSYIMFIDLVLFTSINYSLFLDNHSDIYNISYHHIYIFCLNEFKYITKSVLSTYHKATAYFHKLCNNAVNKEQKRLVI